MNKKIIVLGAGGHAKVCIELLRAMGEQIGYCVGQTDSPDRCLDVPVLKGDENLVQLMSSGYTRLFVAVGSNTLRVQLANVGSELGYKLVNAISPHAIISPTARLGSGMAIMAGVIINAESEIADLAILNTGATIDHDCRIGRAVHVGPQCALAGNVVIGERTFLGVGCKVLPGVVIGSDVVVGAGAVVTSNIDSGITVVGVPARVIKR